MLVLVSNVAYVFAGWITCFGSWALVNVIGRTLRARRLLVVDRQVHFPTPGQGIEAPVDVASKVPPPLKRVKDVVYSISETRRTGKRLKFRGVDALGPVKSSVACSDSKWESGIMPLRLDF